MILKKMFFLIPLATAAVSLSAKPSRFAIYVAKHTPQAIKEMKATGIPACIIIAQASLESANGTSNLAKRAHNHFGVKRPNSNDYKRYANADQSFEDHARILKRQKCYAFLFNYAITDYKSWAYGLYKAGYATDKDYPQKLITRIEDNGLFIIDLHALYTSPYTYYPYFV